MNPLPIRCFKTGALHCLLAAFSTQCWAGEADVIDATATCDANRVCTFTVTVLHEDTGWEHYADHWRILTPGQEELGKRILLHPHESEQPFTRTLSGVTVPRSIERVTVEAHDSVHGYGGSKHKLNLP